jgi:hypothetical protein
MNHISSGAGRAPSLLIATNKVPRLRDAHAEGAPLP